MSLEAALAANTEAVNRLCALMQGANIAPNPAAPVVAPPPPTQQNFAPPPAPAAQAMPTPPFPGAAAPQTGAAPARPFNDVPGLLAWAEATYKAKYTIPGYHDKFGAVLQQHGLAEFGAAQPHQFDSLYQAITALG